ncbi:MAG: hypothetical protein DRO06_02500 [Thermoproteota archaeon]|nr:MAG: hypothetical protein DRO06_02500 [Candidatus Korarchaeota archaeon]
MRADPIPVLEARRSFRRFRPDPVEREKIERVLYAGRIAPSSKDSQPWRFYVVRDPELRRRLASLKPGHGFVAEAPVVIVVTCDSRETRRPLEDGSCAALSMWIAACGLGLGAVWVAVANTLEDEVREVLGIPRGERVICMLPIGYPAEEPRPKEIRPEEEVVRWL